MSAICTKTVTRTPPIFPSDVKGTFSSAIIANWRHFEGCFILFICLLMLVVFFLTPFFFWGGGGNIFVSVLNFSYCFSLSLFFLGGGGCCCCCCSCVVVGGWGELVEGGELFPHSFLLSWVTEWYSYITGNR